MILQVLFMLQGFTPWMVWSENVAKLEPETQNKGPKKRMVAKSQILWMENLAENHGGFHGPILDTCDLKMTFLPSGHWT